MPIALYGEGGVSVARRRTIKVLTSGVLFVVVAFVAGFVFTVFTDSWVLAVVVGLVVAAAVEWVYAALVWRPGRRRSGRGPEERSPPEG